MVQYTNYFYHIMEHSSRKPTPIKSGPKHKRVLFKNRLRHYVRTSFIGLAVLWSATIAFYLLYELRYEGKIYPSVYIGDASFGGTTPDYVREYWTQRNEPFLTKRFELQFEGQTATLSATELDIGYDATLSARQAYLIGRSGNFASDTIAKLSSRIDLNPYFRWNEKILDDALEFMAERIDIPVQEALFAFAGGKVTAFKPSREGRKLNSASTKANFSKLLASLPSSQEQILTLPLVVDPIKPAVQTQETNVLGIQELIGRGYSEFAHSIPSRIHNVALTASKINGILVKPGEIFSFNQAVGDISEATGFQPAYIIKDGRTVLGDGGGVCQVSTTLFRAALAAGLPIIKRQAHAYRVGYYEQAGYKAGIDATVFAPSVDFQFKNDTPGYILIQTTTNRRNLTLTIDLYGTNDGRKAEILNHVVGSITPPPPDLYQDDPTLPAGTVKQVDFAAWGAKTSFQYKVTRNGEILQDETFYSNFRPWQAVFLRGPQI